MYIISIGLVQPTAMNPNQSQSAVKTAAFILPSRNFQEEEFFQTISALNNSGIQSVITSTQVGTIRGATGRPVNVSIPITQLNLDNVDALIFIGGDGVTEYFNNPVALDLVSRARQQGKVIAAISSAPIILANAGILRGVRATSTLTTSDMLRQVGAIYNGLPVEVDQGIITAVGAQYAASFSQNIIEAMSN